MERILEVAFVQLELRAGLLTWRGQDVRRQQQQQQHTHTHIYTSTEEGENCIGPPRKLLFNGVHDNAFGLSVGRQVHTRRMDGRPPLATAYFRRRVPASRRAFFTTPPNWGKNLPVLLH